MSTEKWYESKGLKTIPNEYPNGEGPIEQPYTIHLKIKEFTCLCPEKPDQPDYADFDIEYRPGHKILESKGLKEYFTSYRNLEIFHEPATNRILRDLVACCEPEYMKITGDWFIRGGIKIKVEVEYVRNNISRPA